MNPIHRVPFGTVRTLIGRVSHRADEDDQAASLLFDRQLPTQHFFQLTFDLF